MSLDLEANPVCDKESYREAIFKMLPQLTVLDMKTKDGEELFSDDDDDDYDIELGEGGEDELDEVAMMAEQLTEKQK